MTINQTFEAAIIAAAEFQGIEPLDLLGPRRFAEISAGRFAVFLTLRESGYTHRMIAKAFNLHHSAVVHGSKEARKREGINAQFKLLMDRVRIATRDQHRAG